MILDFEIRGGVVFTADDDRLRYATEVERALWEELQKLRDAQSEQFETLLEFRSIALALNRGERVPNVEKRIGRILHRLGVTA
jgi:hypothetical protein